MKVIPLIKPAIYILIVLVSLAILALVALSPAQWSDVGVVYRGF